MEETVCMKCEGEIPRPSVYELVALVAVAYLFSVLLQKLGLAVGIPSISENISVIAAITIGLFAGTSSCISLTGGLLLSSARELTLRRTAAFALGRVLSYTVFGGLIGALGQVFVPSPTLTSILIILASLYMLYAGLDLLQLVPRVLVFKLPIIASRLPRSPILLGAFTFFLPCGFTQSLQLYALTTGSPVLSALILGGFALGTVPALFALGFTASQAKGNTRHLLFHFAGVVVIILGSFNIANGLRLLNIDLTSLFEDKTVVFAADPYVRMEGNVQVIAMSLGENPAYSPSDHYTVRAGMPVRFEISGRGEGCRSVFQIPQAGVSVALTKPKNIIEFTPEKPGRLTFSCSMGMYPGSLEVI